MWNFNGSIPFQKGANEFRNKVIEEYGLGDIGGGEGDEQEKNSQNLRLAENSELSSLKIHFWFKTVKHIDNVF